MGPMDAITEGTPLEIVDALGRTFPKRALSAVERSGLYPVVWACSEDEWAKAAREGREPDPETFPWPLEQVRVGALA